LSWTLCGEVEFVQPLSKVLCGAWCRELRLRQTYVEHLENLTLQKDDEKDALQKHVLQQVTGVYKLAEEEAVQRLSAHTKELQVNEPHDLLNSVVPNLPSPLCHLRAVGNRC